MKDIKLPVWLTIISYIIYAPISIFGFIAMFISKLPPNANEGALVIIPITFFLFLAYLLGGIIFSTIAIILRSKGVKKITISLIFLLIILVVQVAVYFSPLIFIAYVVLLGAFLINSLRISAKESNENQQVIPQQELQKTEDGNQPLNPSTAISEKPKTGVPFLQIILGVILPFVSVFVFYIIASIINPIIYGLINPKFNDTSDIYNWQKNHFLFPQTSFWAWSSVIILVTLSLVLALTCYLIFKKRWKTFTKIFAIEIILLALVFSAILLFGKANPSGDQQLTNNVLGQSEQTCEAIADKDKVAECLYGLALNQKNVSLCGKIPDNNSFYTKEFCIRDVSTKSKDSSYCQQVADKDNCLYNYAVESYTISACDGINPDVLYYASYPNAKNLIASYPNLYLRDSCYDYFLEKTSTGVDVYKKYCPLIRYPRYQEICNNFLSHNAPDSVINYPKSNPAPTTTTNSSQSNSNSNWKTYASIKYSIYFEYPSKLSQPTTTDAGTKIVINFNNGIIFEKGVYYDQSLQRNLTVDDLTNRLMNSPNMAKLSRTENFAIDGKNGQIFTYVNQQGHTITEIYIQVDSNTLFKAYQDEDVVSQKGGVYMGNFTDNIKFTKP